MKRENTKKFLLNILKFSSPAIAIFLYQLQKGVELKEAGLVALLALYGILADLFSKIGEK